MQLLHLHLIEHQISIYLQAGKEWIQCNILARFKGGFKYLNYWIMLNLIVNYPHLCTTVHDSDLEDGRVWGGDHRQTLRVIPDREVAGIDGWVCVCGLHGEHKVSIQRAGCREGHTQEDRIEEQNRMDISLVSWGSSVW